ncbi:MAG: aldehyde dehydrogenase family protein, partial [Deinococcales bacterium]
ADTLRISAEEARGLHGETLAFDQRPGSENRFGYFVPEPVGIVAAITPFNDPLNLVAHKVGPAIAAGNAIVLKPDSKTPLSALKLGELLLDSGLPADLLQVVTGRGSVVGDALVRDGRVRVVSFTGGKETGEAIVRAGGLKRYSMELGSNAPTIVLEDADLEAALPAIVSGAFWAAGQNCLHVQRLLVQDAVYEEVRERMVAGAEAVRTGPKLDEDTDMGPVIDAPNVERIAGMVEEARTAGAHLLTGGGFEGTHFEPTLLEGVPATSRLARDEVYGPVTILHRVADLDEAVAVANDVDYGLQAAVFTRDLGAAHRAVSALHYGGVMVNDSTDYRIDAMPFGGVKGSGLGREGVRFAVHEMTELKLASFALG